MALVFVHGSGCSGLYFHYQARHFKPSYAVNLPGHPEGEPCTGIQEYVEWLRSHIHGMGLSELVLAGHSMGGAIAQLYALTYPQELRGIVLIGAGARLRVHPKYLEECQEAMQGSNRWLENQEAGLSRVDAEVREMLMQSHREIGPAVMLNDLRCCDEFDIMDRVQEVRLPALVICGSDDAMTPVKYAQYLAEQINGSQLLVLDGTHMIHLEQPQQVNQAIERFLD